MKWKKSQNYLNMLEYQSTILSPTYKERAVKLEEVLGREDLFESKKAEFKRKLRTFKEKYNV